MLVAQSLEGPFSVVSKLIFAGQGLSYCIFLRPTRVAHVCTMFFVLPRRVYDKACCFAEGDVSRFLCVPLTIAEFFRRDFLHVFQNVL